MATKPTTMLKRKQVYCLIGTDREAISIATQILPYNTYKPGKVAELSNTIIDKFQLASVDNIPNLLKQEAYLEEPSTDITTFCKEAIAQEGTLLLADVSITYVLAWWLKAFSELEVDLSIVYFHKFNNKNPILNLAQLMVFELISRDYHRYCLSRPIQQSELVVTANGLFQQANIDSIELCQIIIDEVSSLNPTQAPQSFTARHLENILIHNTNSQWPHSIEEYKYQAILEEINVQLYQQWPINLFFEVEIHHKTNEEFHIERRLIQLSETTEIVVDLSSCGMVHQLKCFPISGMGLVQLSQPTFITKSNKTLYPAYNIQGDKMSSAIEILDAETNLLTINTGTYNEALKYLKLNLKILSQCPELIQIKKYIGDVTKYPKNRNILLEPTPYVNPTEAYNIELVSVFQERYAIVKGWFHSEGDKSKLTITIGKTKHIIVPHLPRKDINAHFNIEDDAYLCGFHIVFEVESVKTSDTNYKLSITINEEKTLDYIKPLRHVDSPSALTLDNQYQIMLYQKKQASEPDNLPEHGPTISIVTPVYNVDPIWLNKCVESVLKQSYQDWELCLYDDKSTNQETLTCLQQWSQYGDPRILVGFGEENLNISAATNGAIAMSSGEYVAFMDNDDELHPLALSRVARCIADNPSANLMYSDEDKLEMNGMQTGPYFKSSIFNIDLLRSNNYITHLTVVRRDIGEQVGWIRLGYEGAQDHDFVLRVIDHIDHSTINHIPHILYHWRKLPTSTAGSYGAKDYAYLAGKASIEDHLRRNQIKAEVKPGVWGGAYRIVREIADPLKVSIIIPFKDQAHYLKPLIKSIYAHTTYPNFEIILLDNRSEEPETKEVVHALWTQYEEIEYHPYDHPFNYSAMNNWAVSQTTGEYILLLNNDMEVKSKGWLTTMVEHIQREEVGAVGCKLLFEDNSLQHAGVLMGINGSAGHSFKGMPNGTHYFNMGLIKNVSGVTGACLLTKRSVYTEVGGLDEDAFKVAYNDVDYCLKVRQAGYLIVYTPYAELYHYESKTRGYEDTPEKEARHNLEKQAFQDKWENKALVDPYFNPNFSYQSQTNALAIDPKEL